MRKRRERTLGEAPRIARDLEKLARDVEEATAARLAAQGNPDIEAWSTTSDALKRATDRLENRQYDLFKVLGKVKGDADEIAAASAPGSVRSGILTYAITTNAHPEYAAAVAETTAAKEAIPSQDYPQAMDEVIAEAEQAQDATMRYVQAVRKQATIHTRIVKQLKDHTQRKTLPRGTEVSDSFPLHVVANSALLPYWTKHDGDQETRKRVTKAARAALLRAAAEGVSSDRELAEAAGAGAAAQAAKEVKRHGLVKRREYQEGGKYHDSDPVAHEIESLLKHTV